MPNWVYNRINVSSRDDEVLADFEGYISTQPAATIAKGDDFSGFSFHSFITLDEEHFDEYHTENGSGPSGSFGDTEYNWYNWNTKNWETKWDAANVYTHKSRYNMEITFETAWSPPTPIWQAMTNKFPELRFDIWWEEEQGFGEELIAENGTVTIDKKWNVPDSHQDYVDQDKLDGCLCSYYTDPDEWYSDCPRDEDDLVTYVIETVTKRYITAYSVTDAIEAAKADEAGYDLPDNTKIVDVLYAEEYREETKKEETNE